MRIRQTMAFLASALMLAPTLVANDAEEDSGRLAFDLPAIGKGDDRVRIGGQLVADAEELLDTAEVGSRPLTAVVFLGTQCPMARNYVSTLNQLQLDFKSKGVRVIGVFSNRQDSTTDIAQFAKDYRPAFSLAYDEGNIVADRYGATRTPEVFLLDGELRLRYHGRINDQYAPGVARTKALRQDLRLAIDQLLAGRKVQVPETRALGCLIGRVKQKSAEPNTDLTFHGEIYEVLQRNCIECHRAGEIGPFAMEEYEEVAGWADTMLETIEDQRMPPWHADPSIGSFANERRMSEEDKRLFKNWVLAGAPEGEKASSPPSMDYVEGWQLPKPAELILPMRSTPFVVPKDGTVEYQYFVVDPKFKEDKWVRAAQVIPGNAAVVHHVLVFIRPPDLRQFNGMGWIGGYVPGQRVFVPPEGYARKVPAGSKLVFQMHYTPIGSEEQDLTQIGFNFVDESEVTHEVSTRIALDQEFEIPPGAQGYEVETRIDFSSPATLLSITPHMHYRGSSFDVGISIPGGDASKLLQIPRYDFNWQHTYILEQPISMPAETELNINASFDNSEENPFNPDPKEWVTWGDQTWEEMAVAFFDIARPVGEARQQARTKAAQRVSDVAITKEVERILARCDANANGVIEKSESGIFLKRLNFSFWDMDDDGVIDAQEIRTRFEIEMK